jgi:ribonuclease R
MSLRFLARILDHLRHTSYRPAPLEEVARQMQVAEDRREEFATAVEQLVAEGRLERGADEKLRLPRYGEEATGRLRVTLRGFGFLIPDHPVREGDLFIPEGSTGDAVSGDRVRVKVMRKPLATRRGRGAGSFDGPAARGEMAGRVVEVLERGQSRFAGKLVRKGRLWVIEPDGRVLRDAVVIRDPFAKDAKEGDKCVVEILHWPEEDALAEGVIVEVLGPAGRPDVETEAVIASHEIRTAFPEEAVAQARAAAVAFEKAGAGPWTDRLDLTADFIFTIDPPDAKDFDDAISIAHDEASDEWTLGVHIADVAHFVTAASPLDREAFARGTSVYLPRRVIPMLPEALSNGVCSLQEGVTRFVKSVFITFDAKGRPVTQRLAASAIRSAKRLTYLEAEALIQGDLGEARKHARAEPEYPPDLLHALRLCQRLAKILEARRKRDGMISLQLPQSELVFDEAGHVIDAVPEDSAYTHKVIEMFMVEANEALARTFSDLELPLLRRIHPEPSYGDVEELRTLARLAKRSLPDEPTRRDLQELLEATRDTPVARAVHFGVLRAMAKASYSPALEGHFALASFHYAHFTSPIRRYPDLLVHRAMTALLELTGNGAAMPGGRARRKLAESLALHPAVLDEGTLVEMGRHCTEREIAAEDAERELRQFLILQMLEERHLGDDFEGIVTGVAPNGTIFVSLAKYLVDGAIRSRDLPGPDGRPDRWIPQPATGRLIASRSGASIGIGDLVTVKIQRIEVASRTMDLTVVKFAERREESAGEAGHLGKRAERLAAKADAADYDRGGKGKRGRVDGHRRGFKQGRRGKRSR